MTPKLPPVNLSYPLTRQYPWPWFGPTMVLAVAVSLFILVPVNLAGTGYQIIPTLSSNYNITHKFWFNKLWNAPKPGTLCQPHNFTVGDTLTTDYSLFAWNLVATNTSDPLAPFMPYSGINLDSCDVIGISVDANAQTLDVNINAGVRCLSDDFPILIRTSFTPWGGGAGSFDVNALRLNDQNILDLDPAKFGQTTGRRTGVSAVNSILKEAATDLSDFMTNLYSTNKTVPYNINVRAGFEFCPKTLLAAGVGPCTESSTYTFPQIFFTYELAVAQSANGTIDRTAYDDAKAHYTAPLQNLVQVMHAASRLDIGHILPNNVLTNASAIPLVLSFLGTSVGSLYRDLTYPAGLNFTYPVEPHNSAIFNAAYSCNLTYPRSPGTTLVLLFIGVVGMLTTGWNAALSAATFFVKKEPGTNECGVHAAGYSMELAVPNERTLAPRALEERRDSKYSDPDDSAGSSGAPHALTEKS